MASDDAARFTQVRPTQEPRYLLRMLRDGALHGTVVEHPGLWEALYAHDVEVPDEMPCVVLDKVAAWILGLELQLDEEDR